MSRGSCWAGAGLAGFHLSPVRALLPRPSCPCVFFLVFRCCSISSCLLSPRRFAPGYINDSQVVIWVSLQQAPPLLPRVTLIFLTPFPFKGKAKKLKNSIVVLYLCSVSLSAEGILLFEYLKGLRLCGYLHILSIPLTFWSKVVFALGMRNLSLRNLFEATTLVTAKLQSDLWLSGLWVHDLPTHQRAYTGGLCLACRQTSQFIGPFRNKKQNAYPSPEADPFQGCLLKS